MKTLFKNIILLTSCLVSVTFCSKDDAVKNKETFNSFFTDEEYANATYPEKKLMSQVDAAAMSMEAIARVNPDAILETIISMSESTSIFVIIDKDKVLKDKFVSKLLKNTDESSRSCKLCASWSIISDAKNCVEQIVEDMEGVEEFDIHVKREGSSCVTLSW